ncbi:MAG: flagellar hook-basal body complex protein, partial [Clostridiales bacterium]|nr:flagellar hook-basal body complex protein [Clostridiales bacterium]
MLRSMFSGVSGLRTHQTKMDVIGNNIANVNTVGFKASRATFQEIYNQTLKAASAPTSAEGRGGINAQQVGLGVSVASIDVLHTQGGAQRTDKATDLALEGDGFFVLSDGVSNFYTRAGNFDVDPQGYLVSASGLKVQGWTNRNADGEIITTGSTNELNLTNLSMPPRATSRLRFEGNLDSSLDENGSVEYTTDIVDSLGDEHNIKLVFSRVTETYIDEDDDEQTRIVWHLAIESADANGTITNTVLYDTATFPDAEPIQFDGNGRLTHPLEGIVIPNIYFSNGAEPIKDLNIEF